MERLEEIRWRIVKAVLDDFPELKRRVREEDEQREEVKQLRAVLRRRGYSERAVEEILKWYT